MVRSHGDRGNEEHESNLVARLDLPASVIRLGLTLGVSDPWLHVEGEG